MALRIFLGLALALSAMGWGCSWVPGGKECQVCSRPIHGGLSYRITLTDGAQKDVCCPRCGLHFQAGRDDVASVQASDFATGRLIDAKKAHYVESSQVMMCCRADKLRRDRSGGQYALDWDRCMPSLVAFDRLEDAAEFIRQRGGTLKSYSDLLAEPEFSEAAGKAGSGS